MTQDSGPDGEFETFRALLDTSADDSVTNLIREATLRSGKPMRIGAGSGKIFHIRDQNYECLLSVLNTCACPMAITEHFGFPVSVRITAIDANVDGSPVDTGWVRPGDTPAVDGMVRSCLPKPLAEMIMAYLGVHVVGMQEYALQNKYLFSNAVLEFRSRVSAYMQSVRLTPPDTFQLWCRWMLCLEECAFASGDGRWLDAFCLIEQPADMDLCIGGVAARMKVGRASLALMHLWWHGLHSNIHDVLKHVGLEETSPVHITSIHLFGKLTIIQREVLKEASVDP